MIRQRAAYLAQQLILCVCVFPVIARNVTWVRPSLRLDGNILKAAYPVAWFQLLRGLGFLYDAVLSLLGQLDLWPPLEYALVMFATLTVFSFLRGVVYERRDDAMVPEVYGLMRATSPGSPKS